MSNQGKAYQLTDDVRGRLLMHARGWLALSRDREDFGAIDANERLIWQLSTTVPTAQEMYNEVMRRYDALPTQWGYALIYCWRQVASEWGLVGFQSPKEVSYAESYERLHLTKPLEFEGD